jgi:sec-independent protein translocase protein TatC
MFPFVSTITLMLLLFPLTAQMLTNLLNITEINLEDMTTYSPTEFIRLKIYISLIGSILLSHPLWYRGIYNFSSPGLTPKEKRGMIICLLLGTILFLVGNLLGLFYLAPYLLDLLLDESSLVIAKLSVYQTAKLLISISIFSGILVSLPLSILLASEYTESKKSLKKYIYILIGFLIILGTPEPSLIINLIFLILFTAIMELTLVVVGDSK